MTIKKTVRHITKQIRGLPKRLWPLTPLTIFFAVVVLLFCASVSALVIEYNHNTTKQVANKHPAHSPVTSIKQPKTVSAQATLAKPSVAPTTPTSTTSTPSPAPAPATASCNDSAAAYLTTNLISQEEALESQYVAVPLLSTTESELIINNGTIGQLNIDLQSDYTTYVGYLHILDCPVAASAPTPYTLQTDPGNLPP